MANTHNPAGFRPVKHRNGAPYAGQFRSYSVAAGYGTALMIGDAVILAGTSQTINGKVLSDVERCATGGVPCGVIVGVKPDTQDSLRYRAASTLRTLYVADDPDLLFEIIEGNSGTALADNDAGLNIDFVVASGNTTTGLSGTMVNNATEAGTNTLDLHLVEPVASENNEVGYSRKWLVTFNRHQYRNQVAGI
jgi:hypothetical protein